ncbi:MAG: HDOD domain-containing protein [Gammaproteobacteria bacterium]|nr:HDOD domain-containing protein [Gammaproteobacteria bacterium]
MTEHALFLQIFQRLRNGELPLPSLPDIGLRVREAVRDPNQSLQGIAKVVQMDPALAAYLVSVANSPLFRGAKAVDSCQTAVGRLGLSVTGNLVTSYSLKTLFANASTVLTKILRSHWQASVRLGALSSVLARQTRSADPDRALLGGLLQDIGTLPIIANLANKPAILADEAELAAIIEHYVVPVGGLLLKHWQFDEDMLKVVASREDWMRDPGPKAELADLVLLARLHAYVGTPAMRGCPRINAVPAYAKLNLGELSPAESLQILEAARQEIGEVQRLMAG